MLEEERGQRQLEYLRAAKAVRSYNVDAMVKRNRDLFEGLVMVAKDQQADKDRQRGMEAKVDSMVQRGREGFGRQQLEF